MRQISLITALVWHLSLTTWAKTTTAHVEYGAISVCSSTTINYITQTLPQQCLRTDWTRPGSNASGEALVTQTPEETRLDDSVGSSTEGASSASDGSQQERGESPKASAEMDTEGSASKSADAAEGTARTSTAQENAEEDGDPLDDQTNFLSFEDWKAQMLEKAGQSPDHIVGTAVGSGGAGSNRRRQQGIENALDSLGEEGEIELEFGGFVNPDTAPRPAHEVRNTQRPGEHSVDEAPAEPPVKRSKEAGTTSKERFNYASFDCAATILKTNSGSKGATWILSENKDSYLLNKCSDENKHFIVELCNDILIDTIVLGNFEFFSSTFRQFRVSISDRYPVKSDKWRQIGTFEARNTRGVQAFMVENGLIWARYLKVELLTHYGKEYYCPVSLLRVHGKTMIDDYRNEVKEGHEQDEAEDDEETQEGENHEDTPVEVIAIPPIKDDTADSIGTPESTATTSTEHVIKPSGNQGFQEEIFYGTSTLSANAALTSAWKKGQYLRDLPQPLCELSEDTEPSLALGLDSKPPTITPAVVTTEKPVASNTITSDTHDNNTAVTTTIDTASNNPNATMQYSPATPTITDNSTTINLPVPTVNSTGQTTITNAKTSATSEGTDGSRPAYVTYSGNSSNITAGAAAGQVNNTTVVASESKQANGTSSTSVKSRATKSPTPIKAAPAAVPATQDSFFRSVHRRLQMLESNSTLSLQYIEEQSRMLRDAFGKAEKRQLLRTSNFLETLNSTVLGELRNFRTQYDQIWQSTVLELASQREQSQKEVRVLGDRLGILADELVWQKRVVYLQFILIVLCLGIVIFSKNGVAGGSTGTLELSLLQSIQNLGRGGGSSVSFAKRYPSSLESPPGTPSRPGSMGGLFARKSSSHRRHLSDGVTSGEETGIGTEVTTSPEAKHPSRRQHHSLRKISDVTTLAGGNDSKSPSVDLQPATPASEIENDDEEDDDVPEADPMALKRAASSPALGRQAGDDTEEDEIEETNDNIIASVDRLQIPGTSRSISNG